MYSKCWKLPVVTEYAGGTDMSRSLVKAMTSRAAVRAPPKPVAGLSSGGGTASVSRSARGLIVTSYISLKSDKEYITNRTKTKC